MRLRLLRRRLMLSAPRMSVRRVMPWPLRWLTAAVMLGLCTAVGLWAFDFGKSIAGFDGRSKSELASLRAQVAQLQAERDQARSVSNTSESLLKAEQAAQEQMLAQVRQLQSDNLALRADLGFFETLLPAASEQGISIRAFQAERVGTTQVRWQLLVMQPAKSAPEFKGQVELAFSGNDSTGKAWTKAVSGTPQPLQFRQYRRIEGVVELPAAAVVKSLTAKVVQGTAVRATQTVDL